MLRSTLLCLSMSLPKSFKQIEFCNMLGLFNVIYAVINLRDGKCVRFFDRIYLTVVCTRVNVSSTNCRKT